MYSFAETIKGDFWIGCEIGLNRLVRKTDGSPDYFIRYSLAPDGVSEDDFLRHNFIKTIWPAKAPNTLWIGTSIGLKKVKYDPDDLSKIDYETYYHDLGKKGGLSHRFVADILEEEEEQKLWIATYNGLNVLDTSTETFDYVFASANQPNSLSNNVLKSLFKDRSGVLWIGTEKGVNNLNLKAKPFQNIRLSDKGNTNNDIISWIETARSRTGFWVGSNGGGLNFIPISNQKIEVHNLQHYPLQTSAVTDLGGFVSALELDKSGWLWIATQGAGIVKMKEADIPILSQIIHHPLQFTKEDKLSDDYVMSLLESQQGGMWIGYWDKGLDYYNPISESFQNFSHTKDFSLNLREFPIVDMLETEENGQLYLWLARRGGGVLKLKHDTENQQIIAEKTYLWQPSNTNSLSNDFVNCLFQNQANQLWIGTENGLNHLNIEQEEFQYFLEKDGLANSIIQSILGDEQGNIWVSTQKGISCLHSENEDITIKNFDNYDGLQDNFFYANSAATFSNQLLFGGVNGLNTFAPQNIEMDSTPPQVAITNFKLFNQSVPIGKMDNGRTVLQQNISETTELVLNYNDNVLAFEYVGLHFGEPEKIQYAHQLEGFDSDWVYTNAAQRIAHYTNLPYKDFVFKVKAANGDGMWSDAVSLKLSIQPPIWLTTGAYVFYVLLFFALLYGVRKITKNREKLKHSLQLEKLEREKLEEVNQMKLRFFTNISHELRTPLTLIISPLEQMVKEKTVSKKLHQSFVRMHYNANRLLTMINQLLDIRKNEAGLLKLNVAEENVVDFAKEIFLSFKGLAKQRQIKYHFSAEKDELMLWYDRNQLEKVLFNLLSNAFKFTPDGGEIQLAVSSWQSTNLLFNVKDNGQGIPPEELESIFERFYSLGKESKSNKTIRSTGIGLALSKSIVVAHHGEIWAESKLGKGSTFYVLLPKGDAHFTKEQRTVGTEVFGINDTLTTSRITTKSIDLNSSINTKTTLAQTSKSASKSAILIVEDNPDIRSYLKENLEETYQISEAADGEQGLEKALAQPPDLVLADIAMPKMDGIELCQKIKTNLDTSHIPLFCLLHAPLWSIKLMA